MKVNTQSAKFHSTITLTGDPLLSTSQLLTFVTGKIYRLWYLLITTNELSVALKIRENTEIEYCEN